MNKKLISWLMALCMAITLLPQVTFASNGGWTGGGTEGDPYLIEDLADLELLAQNVNNGNSYSGNYFKVTNDIDMSSKYGANINGSEVSWTPIGTPAKIFSGTFDGGKHTVSGIYINAPDSSYQGLFGSSDGTVKNISVSGSVFAKFNIGGVVAENKANGCVENSHNIGMSVSGIMYVGGIVGTNSGTIKHCSNLMNISINTLRNYIPNAWIAGIAGVSSGTIENCSNTANITVKYCDGYIGGIAGSAGKISGCFNTGNIDVTIGSNESGSVGGIAGYVDYNDGNNGYRVGVVTDCYNIGSIKYNAASASVNTHMGAGGIVGDHRGTLTNCYSTGSVEATKRSADTGYVNVGGAVGKFDTLNYAAEINNCFYIQDCKVNGSVCTSSWCTSKTADEFKDEDTFTGWDFDTVWEMDTASGKPILRDNNADFEGSGTENNPYLIPDLETLELFRNSVNNGNDYSGKVVKLTADIDMSSKYGADGESWLPIGKRIYQKALADGEEMNDENTPTKPFSGTFDGCGHTISGLYINLEGTTSLGYPVNYTTYGLFGYITNAEIKNLGVSGEVKGYSSISGIVGTAINSTISNCYNKCDVSGIASPENASSPGTHFYEDISVGGIVGIAGGSTIKNCYNIGKISSVSYGTDKAYTGSIAGYVQMVRVSDCYYIETEGGYDIGAGDGTGVGKSEITNVFSKTADEFKSGEVAYLLQSGQTSQVWGQNLIASHDNPDIDDYPVFTSDGDKKVLKVTFKTKQPSWEKTEYTNKNGCVEIPEATPTNTYIYGFYMWSPYDDPNANNIDVSKLKEFTGKTPVTEDITLYAFAAELEHEFGAVDEEKKIDVIYGTETKADLSNFVKFSQEGLNSKDNFKYTVVKQTSENDNKVNVIINGDIITIPADTPAGNYSITIKAEDKNPQGVVMLAADYGVSPIEFDINVKVAQAPEKMQSNITIDYINELLTDFETGGSYTIDGTAVTPTDGKLAVGSYIGSTISIVKKAEDENHSDSEPQSLVVPARPAAPTESDFTVTQPSQIGGTGSISGVTADMEYSADGGTTWVNGDGNDITGIAGGKTYVVRYKATTSAFKSLNCSVAIESFVVKKEETPNITIDYINEKLAGFKTDGSYTIGGTAVTPTDGKLEAGSYIDSTISIVKKAEDENHSDSEAQSLNVPARPAAPTESDFTVTQPNTIGGTGSISGITADMEYSADGGTTWETGDGNAITGIAGGKTYAVRYKATTSAFKSLNYSINIELFGAEKEETPSITIDFENEKIKGFETGGSYTIGDTAVMPIDGELAVGSYIGSTISIVKKGNGVTTNDSTAQSLVVPARPAAPTENEITVTQPSQIGGTGSISGVTADMEYSADGGATWVTGNGSDITGIAGGETYAVRYKAMTSAFKSLNYSIEIESFRADKEETPNITIDFENEKIKGFETGGSYTIGGAAVTPADGKLAVGLYIDSTISIVKKGDGVTTNDSTAQSLVVPARLDAPTESDFTVTQPSQIGGTGSISGITTSMEYSADGGTTWEAGDGNAITGIAGGKTYAVRYKATTNAFKSLNYSINIKLFGAEKEETPSITIDYINELLIGFETDGSYTIGGTAVTPADGELAVGSYIDSTISIVKKGNGVTTNDSEPQSLEVPARPAAPTVSAGNGTITGVTDKMEYKLSDSDEWIAVTGTEVTGLADGNYSVRIKADKTSFASMLSAVEVKTETVKEEYTVTFVNYDDTVLQSLNAAAGETPVYTESTPAKPSDEKYSYTFSGWSPSITAVTGAATYTAQFESIPREYSVTLNANGGKINSGNIENYTYGTAVTLPKDIKKTGYTFGGWYDNEDCKGTAVTEISADASGDKIFYAKWKKRSGGRGGSSGGTSPVSTPLPTENDSDAPNKPLDNDNTWFIDVPEDLWYYSPIKYVFEKGLMLGVSDIRFAPETDITRGMFVTTLYRMEGEPETSHDYTFKDVSEDMYYTNAVAWAANNIIVKGYSSERFAPEENITREEMAAIIYRYAKLKGYDCDIKAGTVLKYTDAGSISEYAVEAVLWAADKGIMQGNIDNTFAPQANTIRAEAAAVFERVTKKFNK